MSQEQEPSERTLVAEDLTVEHLEKILPELDKEDLEYIAEIAQDEGLEEALGCLTAMAVEMGIPEKDIPARLRQL